MEQNKTPYLSMFATVQEYKDAVLAFDAATLKRRADGHIGANEPLVWDAPAAPAVDAAKLTEGEQTALLVKIEDYMDVTDRTGSQLHPDSNAAEAAIYANVNALIAKRAPTVVPVDAAELGKLKARAEAATPGPWQWVNSDDDTPWDGEEYLRGASLRTVALFGKSETVVRDGKSYTSFALPEFIIDAESVGGNDESNADAAFIAACDPAAILRIAALVAQQAARIAEMEQAAQEQNSRAVRDLTDDAGAVAVEQNASECERVGHAYEVYSADGKQRCTYCGKEWVPHATPLEATSEQPESASYWKGKAMQYEECLSFLMVAKGAITKRAVDEWMERQYLSKRALADEAQRLLNIIGELQATNERKQESELRRAVKSMAALLADREWAEHVSTDEDVAALEAEITRLVGATSERKPLTDALVEVHRFLLGTRPLRGVGFGEKPEGEQGQFWWRAELRRAIDQHNGVEQHHGIGGGKND